MEARSETLAAAVVRKSFEDFDRVDIDGFLEVVHDDVDWRVTGYLTGEKNVRGKEAVRKWLSNVAALSESGEQVRLFQDEYRDLDENTVLVLGKGRIERECGSLEERLGWIWRIEDGLVTYMEDFLSHEEALTAAERIAGD